MRKPQYKTLANIILEQKKINKSLKKILIIMNYGPFDSERHEIEIHCVKPDASLFFLSEPPSKYKGRLRFWYQLYIPPSLEEYTDVTVFVGF